ncbi:MAG: class I adenylate-forming enzyme family protein [Ottowia sp.]|uniref:class I adenylate-forming enzyme family protein n=1 Tax=Ottowia sp. TaxID=1898956 RepID=UPI003C732F06
MQAQYTDPGLAFRAEMISVLERELAEPLTMGELVRRKATEFGDQVLGNWFEDGIKLTYKEFDEKADRLASALAGHGVRKGTHVGVMLLNRYEFPVTWIALARLGAVMVPVNSGYTGEEVHFVLSDSDVEFLVIDGELLSVFTGVADRLPLISPRRVIVAGDELPAGMQSWSELVATGDASFRPSYEVKAHDLVNIQYTSGTTGFPKGCMLLQDYWIVLSRSAAFRGNGANEAAKNVLIWAPFFYMDPQWQFLVALWLGGTAFVAKKMSLTRLHGWLQTYPIHMCIYPEPALKQPLSEEEAKTIQLKTISIFGWSVQGRADIEARFKAVAREGYGMTEIGSGTMVPPPALEKAKIRCVGLPAPFREMKIVDEAGHEVPVGEPGELLVRGRSIMLGYYKRADANREQFVQGWFRTGDIFRRDADNYHYIVGRIKDMIRRAGENIAAIEVESVLRTMPDIEDAAVVAVPDDLRREEVKAYVKLREGVSADAEGLCDCIIEHCKKSLATFKLPRYITFIEGDFPRTAARKVIKRELVKDVEDLRLGAFDRVDGVWR